MQDDPAPRVTSTFGEAIVRLSEIGERRAITYDAQHMRHLWNWCRRMRPFKVLDLGSGFSTVVMAMAMRANGRGHVTALDESPDWAANTRRMLAEAMGPAGTSYASVTESRVRNLDGRVDYLDAPDEAWDLVHVDGPALAKDEVTLVSWQPRLSPCCVVIFDKRLTSAERFAQHLGVMLYRSAGTALVVPPRDV